LTPRSSGVVVEGALGLDEREDVGLGQLLGAADEGDRQQPGQERTHRGVHTAAGQKSRGGVDRGAGAALQRGIRPLVAAYTAQTGPLEICHDHAPHRPARPRPDPAASPPPPPRRPTATPTPRPGGKVGKTTLYDFENDHLDGEIAAPEGANINGKLKYRHPSLITIRPHFIPQLVQMANDV
jgi:hypothetical protein